MNLFRRRSHSPAAEWFVRVRSGGFDRSADVGWTQWMDADAQHAQAYENLDLTWELCGELARRPRVKQWLAEIDAQRLATRADTKVTHRRYGWAAAATVVLCVAAAWLIQRRPVTTDYATTVGEQRVVTLADGSNMALNTATHLSVRYSHASRRIDLFSGEAMFTVAKNPQRPFEVHALSGTTTAVGTQFDVRVDNSFARVSVLEGTVTVQAGAKAGAEGSARISAGQAADYGADGETVAVRGADTDNIRAWIAHRIIFTDVTLADAITDYNRYIEIPIVLGDDSLGSRRINGVFRVGDQAAFLDALQQGLHVTATSTDSAIILKPR